MRIEFWTDTSATSSAYRLKTRFGRLTPPICGSLIGLIQTTSPSSNSTRVSSSHPSATASASNSSTESGGRDSSSRCSTAMVHLGAHYGSLDRAMVVNGGCGREIVSGSGVGRGGSSLSEVRPKYSRNAAVVTRKDGRPQPPKRGSSATSLRAIRVSTTALESV